MAKWVRIEYAAEGQITGYQELDLECVTRVHVGRKSGKVEELLVFYKDEPGMAIRMDNYASEAFLKQWDEFTAAQGGVTQANQPAVPGVIEVAGTALPKLIQ